VSAFEYFFTRQCLVLDLSASQSRGIERLVDVRNGSIADIPLPHVPRGLARVVAWASQGSSGQTWRG
jgi:hypothetical protein